GLRGSRAERAVDEQRVIASRRLDRRAELGFEIGAKRGEPAGFERDPRSHRMTAAPGEKPVGDGAAHRAAEIDASERPAGAGADARRVERDGEGRTLEFLLQSRGNEAEHAWVPALG